MTIKDALLYGTSKLKHISKTHKLDTELILAFVLKKSKEFLFAKPEHKLSQTQINHFKRLILGRENHKPIAYIIGHKEFFGLDFFVNQKVLIPRPETEVLVEKTFKFIDKLYAIRHMPLAILDLGTGSGCIAVAIAKNIKCPAKIFASDISKDALRIAKKNAMHHRVIIKFIQSDLLKNITEKPDIITANLPYITPALYRNLEPEITKFEPKRALLAKTRNYFYEKLKKELNKRSWKPILIFE